VSDPVEVPQSRDLEPRLANGEPLVPRLAGEPLSLAQRRAGPVLERLGTLAEVVLVSGFPTQLFLIAAMTTFGMQFRTAEGQWSPVFVSTLSLLDTALVLGLIFLFLSSNGERPRAALLGNRSIPREATLGLLLLPIMFLIALLILGVLFTIAPQLHNVPRNPLEDMLQNRRDAVIFGIVAMIAGGVREEVQRGFILLRFRQHLGGGALGVAIYSLLFGLGHLDQGLDAAIAVATLGAIWGTIYLIRGSIVAPMVSHAGFNLAQLIKFMVLR
jgi:membrane protease YdiL (CAAX protease family)